MNCKLIVVACNTATTNAIRELRANMIFLYWYRTCNKTCRHEFKTRKIGILATQGTLISELFNKTAQQFQNTKS
jgi:glutamate racemase